MRADRMTISHTHGNDAEFAEKLRKGLRSLAISVSLLTTRDEQGGFHGLAVTGAVPLSTTPPSIMVAVKQSASSYPAIRESNLFCINHISSGDMEILDRFCRSDMRSRRFASCLWEAGAHGLPYLHTATACFFCRCIGIHDHGDHTIFVGRIEGVWLGDQGKPDNGDPIIWLNGAPVRLAGREHSWPPLESYN
jgi:flavin reductase (DIM6/NTAB) family NADH-FMN oxidoreductase RutF